MCGLAACAIGAGALLNVPGIPGVRDLFAEGPTIRPATAACVLVLGLMLIIIRRINTGRFVGVTRVVLSALFLAVGALAATRLAFLVRGIHEPQRPVAPHTISSLFLLGSALLVSIRATERRRRQIAIVLALAGAALPWMAMLGYSTSTPMFFVATDDPRAGMAITAAVALMIISVGVMGLFPDHGFVALAAARTEGGMLMRVLLPAALFFPLLAGAFFNLGERLGWFGRQAALALNLGITSVIIIGLVLWIGLMFKRRAAEQQAAAEERERLLVSLRNSLDDLSKLQNNLVTVCAWTQRVLDQGKWVRFEEFLDKRLNISITHGISEDAAQDELQNLEEWMNKPE